MGCSGSLCSAADSGLPVRDRWVTVTSEKVPVCQFVGEACVIDLTKARDDATAGPQLSDQA